MTLAWVICPHSVDLRSSHCLLCDGWTRSQAKAVAAERARIVGAVMELGAVETPGTLDEECDWISRAAVLALLESD